MADNLFDYAIAVKKYLKTFFWRQHCPSKTSKITEIKPKTSASSPLRRGREERSICYA